MLTQVDGLLLDFPLNKCLIAAFLLNCLLLVLFSFPEGLALEEFSEEVLVVREVGLGGLPLHERI
jgi:hypothetical protein